MSWKSAAGLRLPEASAEVIASIGEHRVLSTAQVAAIHFPDRSARRTQQVLAYLERAGLVAYVETRRAPRRLWFLTERGAEWAMDAGAERPPKILSPEQAAGPLRAHTLGVNEVGISFLRAARERGEDFGPLSWRHEIAHPLNRGRGRARRTLIADAVLGYMRTEEKYYFFFEQRFVEFDRATLSLERMAEELARYGQLYQAREKGGRELWRYRYRAFPSVICVLAGASRKALVRRRNMAVALLEDHPSLDRAHGVQISFCLLEDLRDRGPFAPIFRSLSEPDRNVDWLGEGVGD